MKRTMSYPLRLPDQPRNGLAERLARLLIVVQDLAAMVEDLLLRLEQKGVIDPRDEEDSVCSEDSMQGSGLPSQLPTAL